MCFFGYRLFLVLLPIWGFFFGLSLGAQSMQALFGTGFLANVTSWVVGFVVGLIFAILSYLFYMAAVAIIGGSLGYMVVVGLLLAIGMNMEILVWLIGIVAGIAMAIVTLRFNLQKWVVIIATALSGAAVVYGAYFVLFFPHSTLLENPIRAYLNASPLLLIMAIVTAVVGIIFQYQTTRVYNVESYDRWAAEG
jgi:hypothetical protein